MVHFISVPESQHFASHPYQKLADLRLLRQKLVGKDNLSKDY